jgi:glycosyltransferase involved in cell wall biosynthesis
MVTRMVRVSAQFGDTAKRGQAPLGATERCDTLPRAVVRSFAPFCAVCTVPGFGRNHWPALKFGREPVGRDHFEGVGVMRHGANRLCNLARGATPVTVDPMAASLHILTPRSGPDLLSIVVPAYNEQEMLPLFREKMTAFMDSLGTPVDLIVVNDGSRDHTLKLLNDWATTEPRLKLLGLARNFGHQAAVTAGLDYATGDAVVIMDADLQDPPDVVREMIARYREGYDVVYGQRVVREGEGPFKRVTAWGFYRFMRHFIHADLPSDAGDFRLISRPCLDALKQMRETHRFLRGMVAWVGFPQTAVQYKRAARAAGETKYPLRKMLRFAWTAAVSFSPAPLRISLIGGVLVALVGVAIAIWAIIARLSGWETTPGWASIMVTLCLLGGAVLISNGILGEYVGRIFEEAKHRPLYIVSYTANVGQKDLGLRTKDLVETTKS